MQDEGSQILGPYIKWHYSRAIRELLNVLENFVRFVFHFFSIRLLLRTFFSPWRRMHEEYDKTDLGNVASSLLVNAIMRVFGMVLRSVIIAAGLIFLAATLLLSVAAVFAWLLFPLLVVAILSSGAILIFSAI